MKTIFSLLLLISSMSLFAASQKILTITNDLDKSSAVITLNDVDGVFQNIQLVETENGKTLSNVKFTLSQLKQGALIKNQQGRKVLVARLNSNFDPRYGGEFIFDFLNNGLTNSRLETSFDLGKNGSKWEVTKNNKVAARLHVVSRKIVGQVVGISRVEIK